MKLFPLIQTQDIHSAGNFYCQLFGFNVVADVGWYIHLAHPEQPEMQLAFMDKDHSSIPSAYRVEPAGVIVTVEVDDADRVLQRAGELKLPLHSDITSEEWGQRHFITRDPTGLLVDVVQPIPASPEFLARHGMSEMPSN